MEICLLMMNGGSKQLLASANDGRWRATHGARVVTSGIGFGYLARACNHHTTMQCTSTRVMVEARY